MKKYLIGIHKAVNLTFNRYQKLDGFFDRDWQRVWQSKISDWQAARIDKKGIEKFFSQRDKISLDQEMDQLEMVGANVLFIENELYPIQLKHIYNPPVLLYYRGNLSTDLFPSISVVGSRKISSYGKRALDKIVSELAVSGVTIVSGLAYGADFWAHKVAVENQSKTIAVLGNAIDKIYPAANQKFADDFLAQDQGVILSEYLPGTPTAAEFFPQRNRIVSGLSKATIIIEAAAKSGSLITAKLALDQGKEVFAVPGEVFARNSEGTNALIANGEAQLVFSGQQVLEYLGLANLTHTRSAQRVLPNSGLEGKILELFQVSDKIHINDIVRQSGLPAPSVSANVSLLEIKGFLKNLGESVYGKNF